MALTAAEKAERDALELEVGPMSPETLAAASGGNSKLTPEEQAEVAQLELEVGPAQSVSKTAKDYALGGLGAVGKLASALYGTTTGPALGLALEKATGKKMFTGEDIKNAINPTNLKSFPSVAEMAEKAGVPEGGKLSDVVSGYKAPGAGAWYEPERGGLLDPTIRGTGATVVQAAIDPLTYLTGGASAAAKETAATASAKVLQNAARAAESLPTKVLKAPLRGASAVAQMAVLPAKGVARAVESIPYAGPYAAKALNPVGEGLSAVGKKLYGTPLQPVEFQGDKFNKTGMENDFYQAGIKSPMNLNRQVQEKVMRPLGRAKGAIEDAADSAGGRLNMSKAVEPGMAEIDALLGVKDSATNDIGLAMRERPLEWLQYERGTPATPGKPPSYSVVDSPILGADGRPVQKQVFNPGTPGKPGRAPSPYSVSEGADLKSQLYNELPDSKWAQGSSTPAGQGVKKQLARGLKNETEAAIDRALGEGAGAGYADINRAYGGAASTQRAQATVANRSARKSGQFTEYSPADNLTAGVGAATGKDTAQALEHGAVALGLKKLGQAWDLARMPTGALLRDVSEDPLAAMLMQAYTSKKLNDVRKSSPWLKEKDDE